MFRQLQKSTAVIFFPLCVGTRCSGHHHHPPQKATLPAVRPKSTRKVVSRYWEESKFAQRSTWHIDVSEVPLTEDDAVVANIVVSRRKATNPVAEENKKELFEAIQHSKTKTFMEHKKLAPEHKGYERVICPWKLQRVIQDNCCFNTTNHVPPGVTDVTAPFRPVLTEDEISDQEREQTRKDGMKPKIWFHY